MTNEFIEIAIENVSSIYHSSTESFYKNDFKGSQEYNVEAEQIILFLEENEFIELEDGVYFLTPETYHKIESNRLKGAIYSLQPEEYKIGVRYKEESLEERVNDIVLKEEDKKQNTPFRKFMNLIDEMLGA